MNKHLLLLTLLFIALFMLQGCCPNTYTLLYEKDPVASRPTLLDKTHNAHKNSTKLIAGSATVDITSKYARTRGIYLGGFDQGRRNTAVRDPVYAHCLYMDTGNDFVVFVEIDSIGIEYPDVKAIQHEASKLYPQHIIISAAHDHVGPDTIGFWGPAAFAHIPKCSGRDEPYMTFLKKQVVYCINQAIKDAKEAKLRFATARADHDLSRNLHYEIIDQKDDTVNVMQLVSTDGNPIAVMVNYGNHAEAMWNDYQLSADWPGVMYKELSDLGTVVFVQGALGGLVTVDPGRKLAGSRSLDDVFKHDMPVEKRIALRNKVGKGVAMAVRKALSNPTTWYGPDNIKLDLHYTEFSLPNHNWVFEYMAARGLIKRPIYTDNPHTFLSAMALVNLFADQNVIAQFLTIPGEPAPPVFKDIKARLNAPWKFVIGLGLDEVGYILRPSEWKKTYYKYERTMSPGRTTEPVILHQIEKLTGQSN